MISHPLPRHSDGASPPGGPSTVMVVAAVAIAAGIVAIAAAQVGKTAVYVVGGIVGVVVLAYSIRDLLAPPLRQAVERAGASRFSAPAGRRPSTARATATAVVGAVVAGLAAWFLAQQGSKMMLAALGLVLLAAVLWLAWPLVLMLADTPPDCPPRPKRFPDDKPPVAYPRPARWIGIGLTVVAAGMIAWVVAQMGTKGLLGLVGGIALVALLVKVRNRTLFFTFVAVCSLTVLLHKSFGPQDLQLSGGAPSVYITTFDAMLVLLYAIWISEGTFPADVRAAVHRRILWLPLIGALFLLPSLLVTTSVWHSLSELTRMSWMYLLFFYLAVRVRTRAMVWAVLGALAVIAAIEFVVVVLQWKTGGVLGLSFLGVPTQLTARTTDTSVIGRPFGTIIHPVFMGATVGSLSLLGLAIGLSFRRSLIKVAALSVAALSVLPLYLAHTRAALVAWAVVAGIVVLVSIIHRRLAWSTVGKVVIVVLIGAAVFWPQLVHTFEENFGTGHFTEEIDSRRQLNDLASSMIADHPELGVGLNNFEVVMGPYEKYGIIFVDNPVHNLYLLYLSETGVVGLVGLLIVGIGIYNVPIRLARCRDPLFGGVGLGVAAVMGFLMVEELLGFSLRQDVPLALFWILAGLAVACSRMAGFEGSRGASSRRRGKLDGGQAGGITSATRPPRRHSPSGATPQGRPIPTVLADLLRSGPTERPRATVAGITSAWPRYVGTDRGATTPATMPATTQATTLARPRPVPWLRRAGRHGRPAAGRPAAGGAAVTPPRWAPPARRRPRWRAGLAAGMAAVLLSFAVGGSAQPSGASVPFQLSQLQIVFAGRTKPADPNQQSFQGIYRANGDGTGIHLITPPNDPTIYNWPQWALGGSRIVFTKRYGPDLDHNGIGDWENLFIMNADGSGVQQLTDFNYRAVQPKVAADGRSVVFTAANPQFPRYAVYRLDLLTLESTNLTQVTAPNGAVDADPKFTPDGRILVAASTSDRTNIDVIDGDGGNRQPITDDQYFNTDAEMSPDSSMVAYAAYRGDHLVPQDVQIDPNNPDDISYDVASWFITVRNLSTGQSTLLNRGVDCRQFAPSSPCQPGDSSGWKPVWTPDGQQIGYTGFLDDQTNCICVVNSDGSNPRAVLTSTTLRLKWFDWIVPGPGPPSAVPASLIGSKAVSSQLLVSATDLAHQGAVALHSERVDMMREPAVGQSDVNTALVPAPIEGSWSADRQTMVFVGSVPYDTNHPTPGPAPPPGQQRREHATLNDLDPTLNARTEVDGSSALKQVFLARADGSVHELTTPWTEDWRDGVVTGDARANTDPVISPDGRYVVFTNHATLTNESFLLRMDLVTGEVINLTNGTAGALRVDDASPKWSPDSSEVAFSYTEGTLTNIFVMRASDGLEVTHVTDDLATDISPAWSPDGNWIVFSHHDGTVIITPDELSTLSGIPTDGWTLVKVEVATGRETQLTQPGDSPAFKPVYSPDGRRIYFIGLGPLTFDIHQVDPSGWSPPTPVLVTPLLNETSIDWK